jgi:hypothetical protein
VVDDHQWLDRASARALGFVARRLGAEPVDRVFAGRDPGEELAGLPEIVVAGLHEADARALLDSVLTGPLDERARDQIVAETRGNPLALIELPRGLSPGQLAGGFGLPGAVPLSGRIEESFGRQLDALPPPTRMRWRWRRRRTRPATPRWCGGRPGGWGSAYKRRRRRSGGLADFGASALRHPLLRSVAYQSASAADRQAIHVALAEVTDPAVDRTAAPGTAPRRQPIRTTRSRTNSSTRRAGRRPAAAWPRRRRSPNARRC